MMEDIMDVVFLCGLGAVLRVFSVSVGQFLSLLQRQEVGRYREKLAHLIQCPTDPGLDPWGGYGSQGGLALGFVIRASLQT